MLLHTGQVHLSMKGWSIEKLFKIIFILSVFTFLFCYEIFIIYNYYYIYHILYIYVYYMYDIYSKLKL